MKKLIAGLLAAAVVSFAAFADEEGGLKVSGFLRGGMSDKSTEDAVYDTSKWMQGDYFGGGSRLRVNVDYTKANGGVTFRYQHTGDLTNLGLENVVENEVIKWAMAFANFADGQVITEAGIITDRFTTTGGWEDSGIDGGKGVRLVFVPKAVAGLTLAAQATDSYAEKYADTEKESKKGKIKFNKNLFGFSAKYENEAFFVTGGAALANYFYGSVGLNAVEKLTLVVEAFHDATDKTKKDNKDKPKTYICTQVEYTGVENLLVALLSKVTLVDGDYVAKITPAVSYDVTDWVKLSAESTIYLDSDDKTDTYATISPAVTFKASPKATATVSGLISTDDKQTPHAFTAGVRYNF